MTPPASSPGTRLPRVLVLMATFQGARWLEEQVRSILDQLGVEIRLVVSDDGSTDGTAQLLDALAAADPRVVRLAAASDRLGAAGNFFRLLRESPLEDVDAVALADQDDIWLPGRLGRAMEVLSTGFDAYSSDVIAFWADGRQQLLGKGGAMRSLDHMFEPAGPGCTYVLGRRLAAEVRTELIGQPERFARVDYHDWFIYAFARNNGFRWFLDDRPTVRYRQHGANDTGANRGWRAAARRMRRMWGGWYRDQILLLAELTRAGVAPAAPMASQTLVRLRRLSIGDRIWLAAQVAAYRRNPRDRAALALLLLLGALR